MDKDIKYITVYKDIKEKINNNTYKIDEKLPTGIELAEKYNCSKITVKKALDILAN